MDDNDKIVSLDARRKADEARRKAEVAAQAKAARKPAPAGRPLVVRPGPAKDQRGGGTKAAKVGQALGRALALVLWGALLAVILVFVAERLL